MKKIEKIYKYWLNPGKKNNPEKYLYGQEKTGFFIERIKNHIDKEDKILEIGSGIGRNLAGLYQAGYKNLSGIEINPNSIQQMKINYKYMADIPVLEAPAENILKFYEDNRYMLIFTMAVLCHIHPDIEQEIFNNIVRITEKYIITIEDEYRNSNRHCARNYKEIFESRNMIEIESRRCYGIARLGNNYIYRFFEKKLDEHTI